MEVKRLGWTSPSPRTGGAPRAAAQITLGRPTFDVETFRDRMAEEVEKGNVRCVVVLDVAPTDLIDGRRRNALWLDQLRNEDPASAHGIGHHRHHVDALLRRLCDWAERLESAGLATLFTTVGKGRWVLNPRLPGQSRGLVTIWNDGGGYVSPQRSVIKDVAPSTLGRLDERLPREIRQNNHLTSEISDEVLALIGAAYQEAADGPRSPGGGQP